MILYQIGSLLVEMAQFDYQRRDSAEELLAGWMGELESVLYSSEVEGAIKEVCPSNNPLDKKDFNPIDYINELFPNEQSLAGIDDRMIHMKVQMKQLDEEIRSVVRDQADSGHDGRQALEEAQEAIEKLFGRIRNIKEKARQSEDMVKKITSDIKQLDNAKKHLTDSVRTLERLRFLITNLEQLQVNYRQRNYSEVSTQLHGAISVVEEFSKYQSIPQIRQLMDRLNSLQYDLGQQIKVDFEKAFSTAGVNQTSKFLLHDACLVVETLGGRIKEELITWFVRLQLSDYDVSFHESLEAAWLDKVDRRYSWLRRALMTYEEECMSIFPPEWGMEERICIQFCQTTRASLSKLMKRRSADVEVNMLLYAIGKTTSFEKLLAQRFLQSKYIETLQSKNERDHGGRKETRDGSDEEEEEVEQRRKSRQMDSPFLGMISRCFEAHLGIYITSQDRSLSQLVDQFSSDIKSRGIPRPGEDGSGVVIPSAADFFVFYKKCLVQCSSLSTGPPLLDLTELFKKYLREYANRILLPNIPKIPTSSSSKLSLGALRRTDTSTEVSLSREDLQTTCCLLCTADYCLETSQQLEAKLKEKIDATLSDKIDLTQEEESFRNIISNCIQLLVQDMESSCAVAFSAMVKIPWQNLESVGDSSPYVSTIGLHIRNTIPLLRETLSSARKYFINFCHKFANVFVPSFITSLYKCKPVSTIAAEQLLLDTHSLKTILLELPSVGSAVSRKPPSSYSKLLNKGMEKAELIVKVVMSPHERAEEFVASYRKLMQGDTDVNNFQRVLEMKGLKRSEQHVLTELFKSRVMASSMDPTMTGEKGRIQPIKKLEKLMRAAI